MINKPLPSKGLNSRIPIIVPCNRRFINQGSTLIVSLGLGFRVLAFRMGFRSKGSGFRIQGLGFRGLVHRQRSKQVSSSGFGLGFGFDVGSRV